VGHLNIGAGRIVYQELTRITKDIQDGVFFEKEPLIWAMDTVKENGGNLHLLGLLSDGGVHSHNTHLYALVEMAKQRGLKNVFIHCLLDGRDVPPTSGAEYMKQLVEKLQEIGVGKVASIQGRFWGMDRDNIWERVEKGYNAIVMGEGVEETCPVQAILNSYENGKTDEFMLPTVIVEDGKAITNVNENDSVIFFNFRPDRARQLTRTFIMPDFNGFERKKGFMPLQFVSMTQYDATFNNYLKVVNPPASMENTLGQYLASLKLTQAHIAETQKYAHVTFFFNGGVEAPNPMEDRFLIDSPKIATFDMKPEMSAPEVTEKALELIDSGKYDVMILNFANCDMVGHTGVMDAAMAAVKEVDKDVGLLVNRILEKGGRAFVTADHGNADQMVDPVTGEIFTAHTTNPVPFIACDNALIGKQLREGGILADIAPTMLDSMGLEVPADMTGKSLIVK
ncbi:MAG: 2,3-bisphosphoglycerate-independent phosphoglycerate mutase, partial [Clostridia bacterium]|nr:2,3-bisphosphoglycerate-independent phosphoglycerate mutase [Clostridia bacterium]